MSRFLPTEFVDSVYDIDISKLKEKGIKGFLFDIDNTLVTYAMPLPDQKVTDWLNGLKKAGFGIYLISNNKEYRVKPFAEKLGVGYIAKALKPRRKPILKACREMGITIDEAVLVGDQLFTDIWGGSRMGMHTILVKPISEVEDSFVKFKRKLERIVMKNWKKKG